MGMTPAQIRRQYWEKGWVAVPGIFSRDEVFGVANLALEIAETDLPHIPTPSWLVDEDRRSRRKAPRKIEHPYQVHEAFRALVTDPRLVELVGEVLGGTPHLFRDQLFMKPPEIGSPLAYHQDNAYYHCYPGDHLIAAWIALDDADTSNGCLRYIEGSHMGPLAPHRPIPGRANILVPPRYVIDRTREVAAPISAGGVVLHHSQVLHSSGVNKSKSWRRAYASHWARLPIQCESDTLSNGYSHALGGGREVAYASP
jgi:ectoine hydroxylase-related dioxygenase (phytanoyl-CoA dioxygenase family)